MLETTVYLTVLYCIVMARWGSRHVTVHMPLHTTTPLVTAPHRVELQYAGTRERPLQTHTSHYSKASVTKLLYGASFFDSINSFSDSLGSLSISFGIFYGPHQLLFGNFRNPLDC